MAHAAPKIEQAPAAGESPERGAGTVHEIAPGIVEDDFLDLTAEDAIAFDDAPIDADPYGSSHADANGAEANGADASAPATPIEQEEPADSEAMSSGSDAVSHDAVVRAVGSLVCSWGSLERTTMDKLTAMRLAAGDVRLVGGRMRPGMARLLAELRALVSMRDRHDKQALVVIAELENHIQRIAQFHLLVISGFQASDADCLLCRDSKNSERRISLADVDREIAMIEMIKERLSAI